MTTAPSLVRVSSGKAFETARGETLLDAALRSNITLAYSCRSGRCGTCKGKTRAGTTSAIRDEIGLSTTERSSGWILTCVRWAESDLDLEIEDLGDVQLSPARTLPCRIHSLRRLSPDVIQVVLRLPPNGEFTFCPGQYIDLIGHGGVRRSYSIANAPNADRQIELHIRAVDGGVLSAYWFEQAQVADLLRLHGPLGTFFLREIDGLDLVFLATGTGIAPVKAILEGMAANARQPRSVSVFWGGRIPSDMYWDVRQAYGNLTFVPVLSRADDTWNGARGHVQHVFLKQMPEWGRTVVYACGSEAMIDGARQTLSDAGLNSRNFISDAFVSSASTQ